MLGPRDHCLIRGLAALCHQVSAAILSYYGDQNRLAIQNKSNNTPLTRADLIAHELLCKHLPALINIPIISEESNIAEQQKRHKDYWLIDPIDGTREFINQTGEFCIAIARITNHRPTLGFIYAPTTNDFWCALVNQGAYKGQSASDQKHEATLPLTRICSHHLESPIKVITAGKKLSRKMRAYVEHNFGSFSQMRSGSALKFCRIAEGEADLYPKLSTKTSEWDIAAGDILLHEAGGGLLLDNGLTPYYGINATTSNPPFIAFGAGLTAQQQVTYARSLRDFSTQ